MAPPSTPPAGSTIHETLDVALLPRPFKSTSWKPAARRNKNLKQVLADASRQQQQQQQAAASLLASKANTEATNTAVRPTPIPGNEPSGSGAQPSLRAAALVAQGASSELQKLSLAASTSDSTAAAAAAGTGQPPAPTYANIEAAPSLNPANAGHWCDITGLPSIYTDPKTKLRYANKEIYAVVRALGPGIADRYLEIRGANVVLK